MMLLSFLLSAAFGWGVARSGADLRPDESPLSLSLRMIGNTRVKAALRNSGADDLKLFNKGSLLDSSPVNKVQVYAGDQRVQFEGIYLHVLRTDLGEDDFTIIGADDSVEMEIDIAELYDVKAGGAYSISAEGTIPYAELDSTELNSGALSYSSNVLTVTVDARQAAKVQLFSERLPDRLKQHWGHTTVDTNCQADKGTATRAALAGCARIALVASREALNGSSAKFQEYFKSTDAPTRKSVSERLAHVAAECNSTGTAVKLSCVDGYQQCGSRVLAYTQPASGYMVNCPLYFTALRAMPRQCHGQDQATTTLHEMTHVRAVYAPSTDDYGYGYAASTKLTGRRAVLNANTYELYSSG